MKIVIYIFMALIALVIGINATKLDSTHLFEGDSSIAVISILAGLCAFVLLCILLISKKISAKVKE